MARLAVDLEGDKEIKTGIGTVETAYGIYIDIDGPSEKAITAALMAPAERRVEVAVRCRGVVKEFTLSDFFKRLGFYN